MSFKEIVDVRHWPKRTKNGSDFDPMMTTVLSLATLFVSFTIALRWFVDYQGVVLQLTLLIAGLTGSSILVARAQCTRWWEFSFDCVFAALVITSIWIWSPGFALSIALSLPLFTVIGLRLWLQITHIQFAIVSSRQIPSTTQVLEPSLVEPVNESVEDSGLNRSTDPEVLRKPANAEIVDAIDPTDSHLETEENPWQFVQDQFKNDESLVQNVAQWHDQDGSRCVVANMRCRFSEPSEVKVLHLPFWPLMNTNPQVFCRVAEGLPATVKTTQVAPHGIRVEVQLDSAEAKSGTPCDVLVEIVASEEADTTECAA